VFVCVCAVTGCITGDTKKILVLGGFPDCPLVLLVKVAL